MDKISTFSSNLETSYLKVLCYTDDFFFSIYDFMHCCLPRYFISLSEKPNGLFMGLMMKKIQNLNIFFLLMKKNEFLGAENPRLDAHSAQTRYEIVSTSLVSAHWASSMSRWPLLKGGGVYIFLDGTGFVITYCKYLTRDRSVYINLYIYILNLIRGDKNILWWQIASWQLITGSIARQDNRNWHYLWIY